MECYRQGFERASGDSVNRRQDIPQFNDLQRLLSHTCVENRMLGCVVSLVSRRHCVVTRVMVHPVILT
jgi:hypothetical protein